MNPRIEKVWAIQLAGSAWDIAFTFGIVNQTGHSWTVAMHFGYSCFLVCIQMML